MDGLPVAEMEPNWQVTLGRRGLLVPGRLFVAYAEHSGPMMVFGDQVPRRYRVVDPRTGDVLHEGVREDMWLAATGDGPRVYLCCDDDVA